jgi:hypothetical protein
VKPVFSNMKPQETADLIVTVTMEEGTKYV